MKTKLTRRTFLQGSSAVALGSLLGAAPAWARDPSLLDDIKKRGLVRIGVQADGAPWGYLDEHGRNAGYDVDVARLLAKHMGVKVEFVSVMTAARIAQLMTRKVDLLVAAMGMYPERAKAVQFSKPYAALTINVIGRKTDKIKSFEDLVGKRVGVERSSAQDNGITKAAPSGVNLMRFDDNAAVIQALLAGQVDAIGGNNTYLINLRKAMPSQPFEEKLVINRQYMGVAMRHGDAGLNAWINQFIDTIRANGTLNAISQKWVEQDLPELPTSMDGVPFTV